MKIEINNTVGAKIPRVYIKRIEQSFTKQFHIKNKIVSLAIVGNKTIKSLNKTYRGRNTVTDVLSFVDGEDDFLGEIIICYPQIKKQASEQRHSIRMEFAIVLVHGLLHLLGYDHSIKKDAKKMFALQKSLVQKVSTPVYTKVVQL